MNFLCVAKTFLFLSLLWTVSSLFYVTLKSDHGSDQVSHMVENGYVLQMRWHIPTGVVMWIMFMHYLIWTETISTLSFIILNVRMHILEGLYIVGVWIMINCKEYYFDIQLDIDRHKYIVHNDLIPTPPQPRVWLGFRDKNDIWRKAN